MNRTFRAFALCLLAGALMGANPSDPHVWNADYEDDPAAGDNVSQGDDWMRNVKKEVRRRLAVEHQVGSGIGDPSAAGDNGSHRPGSARVYMEASEPTTLKHSAELHDNTSVGSGSGTLSAAETNHPSGANAPAVGHGRIMSDTESYSLKVYDDTDAGAATNWGWKEVTAARTARDNIVINGGFEADGRIGIGLATCTDTNDTPVPVADPYDAGGANSANQTSGSADGFCDTRVTYDSVSTYFAHVGPAVKGWAVLGTPTAYSLDPTDIINGYGLEFTVSSDGAGDGIKQTLLELNPATEYQVWARVKANSSATCALDVSAESTTDLPATSATATYTTLTGFFTTDGTTSAPTDVVLELDETAGTGSCSWDHVVIQEVAPDDETRIATNWHYQQTDEVSTADDATMLETDQLTWGGGDCYWDVDWTVNTDGGGAQDGLNLQIDVANSGSWTTIFTHAITGGQANSIHGGLFIDEAFIEDNSAETLAAGEVVELRLEASSSSNTDDLACTSSNNCVLRVKQICGEG